MSISCVNKKDKQFLSLRNKYNVSSSTLENIIHNWQIIGGNNDYGDDFIKFLEDKLGIGNVVYTSKSKYNKAYELWESITNKYTTFPKNKVKFVKGMVDSLFEEAEYAIYETNKEGDYTLKIKKPVYNPEEHTIEYTPKGKVRQTYTIKGNKIFNKEGKEVFKTDSVDRNKIFANLAVQQKRAVVVNYKDTDYVVNYKGDIISTVSGKIMQWGEDNGDRKAIIELANNKTKKPSITFTTSEGWYPQRRKENIALSDITIALAEDFTTAGEKGTKTDAKSKYVSSPIKESGKKLKAKQIAESLVKDIKKAKLPTNNVKLNIAGNGIYSLSESQEYYNNLVTDVIKELQNLGITVAEIRSGGQTGIDEAGIIAAQRLGIPAIVHGTKDWAFRDKSGKDIKGNESAYKARFEITENVKGNKLAESRALVQQMIEDSNKRIKFDKATHTYTVDGKPADTSVTQYIHGSRDLGLWGLPSSLLGTTVDTVTRDYFSNNLKKSYPNLNKAQLNSLIADLDNFKKHLDNKFGKGNYEVVTTEFPIASKYTVVEKNGKRTTKVMAGTMDMLIYDKEGNFYIYDMKTSRSGIKESAKVGYSKQLSLYKYILENNYPQLKGKIKELNLIEFSLSYPNPNDINYLDASEIEDGVEGQLYFEDENGDIYAIQDSSDYESPKLKTIVPVGESKFGELKSLNPSDRELIEEEVGTTAVVSKDVTINKSTEQRITWDNNPLLSATEKRFLANQAMKLASFIISNLNSDANANKHYFGNTYENYNFTSMSRREIIDIVGIGNILNCIKERFYNPSNRTDIDDFDTVDKLQIAYDNFDAVVKQGYSKLISLEDVTVVNARPEFIKREDIEESLSEEMEQGSLEEKEREYWQIGQRQLSAKASLSSTIRRLFEKLPVVDQNGNPVKDEFGFNMDTFVDSNMAINSILTWVNAATTIAEMETILSELSTSNPWLNNILKAIKEEPVRSQFFQNFRKDFLTYSVVRIEYKDGKRNYVTDIINTQGAAKTILQNTVASFKLGLMTNLIIPIVGDLEGRGRVNVDSVKRLKNSIDNITKDIESSFKESGKSSNAITSNINELTQILSKIGLPITPTILNSALTSDTKSKNYASTKVSKILNELTYMMDTLLDNKSNTTYNPASKEEKEGNIYGNYRSIVNILSPFIQDSVESSTYENGKMYYSFTTPSYMGKLVNKLSNKLSDSTKFNEFIEKEYGSYKWFKQDNTWNCPWLEKIVSSETLRQGLQHKVQLSFDRTNYTDLSELSYTLSLMNEYFYDKTKKWAWYRLPILANKPSSEFIRFERLTGKRYKEKIKKGLRKVFNQELMRIMTVLERADNTSVEKIGAKGKIWFDIESIDPKLATKYKKGKLTLNDLIKNGEYIFSGTGAEFKFLSPINQHIINKTELGQMIVDKLNRKEVNEATLDELFYNAVDSFMENQMKIERANWERIGLFDTENVTKRIDGKEVTKEVYKYVSQLGKTDEEINANLEEYVWNDMFATINIIELTATDLAYYKNVEDFQKRYSQVHAPSMRLNVSAKYKNKDGKDILYSADGLERTMYLKDAFSKSDIIDNIAKVFKDKIATLSGTQKKDMEIMASLILQEFEKINIADAQGYSSPTSYRKKMGMQGKWTSEMEEAYQQIREGNLNIDNLGIIWQPLKPFVYSQIRKTSGATTMSELKVPVQNKNSEYLLLVADAIMRSGKQANKLQAIFDFMEDSAYDNNVYNGKGIDTIQFISAVNSGGMGAIDIHSAKTYKEVRDLLEEKAYYSKDRSTSVDNDNDRYDEQYVHAIPFEDYGIQQEVPAHMADHYQAMGSQVRILSVSDISDGTKFIINKEEYSKDKLLKEYFSLIAENIKDSYEQLKKDLGLTGSRLEQNQKLSALLQETILKDQRYGSDLLRACSLDENGEFIIPLSDPIQSTRIQQLLNSIIKSRINKQKVQGGPAVQASAFGLSDDLSIVWEDEDGNLSTSNKFNVNKQKSIAYFECYAPIPSSDMEAALLKEDGSYMTPQEAIEKGIITEEMLKAIGYRIPTEDKYSIMPLKIKGFVPKAAGEAIILPKEITTITGSDFDIDKMYIMFKEFQRKEEIKWKSLKKDILSQRPKGDRSKYENALDIAIDEIKNGNIQFSEGSFEMKVFDYLNEHADKYKTVKFVEKGKNATGDRNNKIFDIQWAVLTHKDTMEKMFNPGSFNVQKKTARIINILKSSNKYTYSKLSNMTLSELDKIAESSSNLNIVFPSTQVYFHKQNMTAGKLIGIFANNNTSHAFLSLQNIQFNVDEEKAFTFNGVSVDNTRNNKVDNLRGKDGTLISKTIAGFLAASVDAVKDPVLNYLNLNTMTANPAMVLIRLGFDCDSVGMFLTQPIIEKVTSEYFKRNNEGYAPIDDIIDDELESLNVNYEALDKDLINTDFTKEELAKGIIKGDSTTEFQVRALLLFQRLAEMGKDLNTLTFLTKFNSVTNAVGPTIADTFVMKERYNKFLDEMNSDTPPFNNAAADVIDNNAMLSAFYETTVGDKGASATIFGRYFPHYSSSFTKVLGRLRETTKGNIDSKTINKLVNDFILYKLTIGDNPVLDGSYESRDRYINKFVKEFFEKSKDIIGNDFINIIKVAPRNAKCPVEALESKTGGYSIDIQESIKDGWSDLLKNNDTNSLGQDLFFYNLFRSGFNFSPKTPGHLASVDVRRAISGYIEAISNPEFEDNAVIADEFLNQFRRNHTQDVKIVPSLKPNSKVKTERSRNVKKENTITFKYDKYRKTGIRPIIVRESVKGITWAPVITYEDKVYMNPVSLDGAVMYTETTTLGNANNFLEYSYNEGSSMKSVIGNSSMEKEDTETPHNPTVQHERKKMKSWTSSEIESALEEVFSTKETQKIADNVDKGVTSKEVLAEYIVDKTIKYLRADDRMKSTILKKLKEKIKYFC